MRSRRRERRGSRGAAAVEFALVVPMLMMLVFGVVDFGYMLNRDTMLNNAAREGVRAASLGATQADVTALVKSVLPTDMSATVTVTVSCTKPTGGVCGSYAEAASGGTAVVKVDYVHTWVTPVGSVFTGKTITLTKTSKMRIE